MEHTTAATRTHGLLTSEMMLPTGPKSQLLFPGGAGAAALEAGGIRYAEQDLTSSCHGPQ